MTTAFGNGRCCGFDTLGNVAMSVIRLLESMFGPRVVTCRCGMPVFRFRGYTFEYVRNELHSCDAVYAPVEAKWK